MPLMDSVIDATLSPFDKATFSQSYQQFLQSLEQVDKKRNITTEEQRTKLESDVTRTLLLALEPIALFSLAVVSAKNGSYLAEEPDCLSFATLSSRLHYCETALLSFAAIIHNFVMTLLFSLAALATLGQHGETCFAAKKHLLLTGISAASLGVSMVGLASPNMGHKAFEALAISLIRNGASAIDFLNPPLLPSTSAPNELSQPQSVNA